jgi:hypothetical protein
MTSAFIFLFYAFTYALPGVVFAASNESYISSDKGAGKFPLSEAGKSAALIASAQDYPGVLLVLKNLQTDIDRVTDAAPSISIDSLPSAEHIVLIGTLGRNPLIDALVREKKLDVEGIAGKWETFLIQTIDHPFPDVSSALVIAGSDKRGTIYGIYDLSANIGVSPWYWWADVPVKKRQNLFVLPGRHSLGEPRVKYRGIFINDEAPALERWAKEKFGGFNSKFYVHVFELLLRLKANFLWPAMWDNSFDTDDTLNPKLADEYGIVMGTSHHEPMMRAWKEWEWAGNKKGSWDYSKNADSLRRYWKEGIRRTKNYECIVTLAMRGDGDEPMSEGANIELLQKIVADQRKILAEVTGRDVTTIPQVWALYKEVQDYYDKGMRVPDDVTLLLCDDNWGNIRRLPKLTDRPRAGGYGIYYHFDYVGGPRSYKWLNTSQISRVWEQMHLAYEYGAKRIWIVNVGDIKPMELPISFFLDYAWNPDRLPAQHLPEYARLWAKQQFGPKYAKDIAEILTKYTEYNARRKPELLSPTTYSLVNYREAETVVADYNELAKEAQRISDALPEEYKDAFYQLVLYPVLACSNLNDLYVTVGKNRLYANQGRAATNNLARKAEELFKQDSLFSYYYNKVMAHGKWNHMMDQTHIGYTSWQQPDYNIMPEVKEITLPDTSEMGVAIEGSAVRWPQDSGRAVLPEFDPYNRQASYIEVFNRGKIPFAFSARPAKSWISMKPKKGEIEIEKRLLIDVDWQKAPTGNERIPITISGPAGRRVVVFAIINDPEYPKRNTVRGFIESNGYVSIEAEHYSEAVERSPVTWLRIPDLGRTLSAMTPMPVTARPQSPGGKSPHLEYRIYFFSTGEVAVKSFLSPTLDFHNDGGPRYAVSFDNEPPQIVSVHENDTIPDWKYPLWWNQAVSENIIVKTSRHSIRKAGEHVLKFWMVDPGVVLQKLLVETGQVKPSYLGPPESFHRAVKMYRAE